jgi:hypothetical protein
MNPQRELTGFTWKDDGTEGLDWIVGTCKSCGRMNAFVDSKTHLCRRCFNEGLVKP